MFENIISNLTYGGAKQTFMYFIFYSLSKIILFDYLKSGILISHICFIKTLLYFYRAIILIFKNTKCVCLVDYILIVQNFGNWFELIWSFKSKVVFVLCFGKEKKMFCHRK